MKILQMVREQKSQWCAVVATGMKGHQLGEAGGGEGRPRNVGTWVAHAGEWRGMREHPVKLAGNVDTADQRAAPGINQAQLRASDASSSRIGVHELRIPSMC